jgi:hypothetical protein
MNKINTLSSSLEATLKNSDLQNITISLAETFSDTLLKDGILKDIPIIGTLVGLAKGALSLNERLLIKKLLYFISELNDIDQEKRDELISRIDNSQKEKIKVGERLLYIIDKSEDHLTAKYIAIIFKSVLKEQISYADFLRCSSIINKIFIHDLEAFIEEDIKDIEKIHRQNTGLSDFQNSLITAGICATETENISIRDQDDYKRNDKYVIEGGNLIIYLTDIGYTLKKALMTI